MEWQLSSVRTRGSFSAMQFLTHASQQCAKGKFGLAISALPYARYDPGRPSAF